MRVLVVNIGSTSFKFRVFDMADESVCAQGGVEGVGTSSARVYFVWSDGARVEENQPVANQGAAVELCLRRLREHGIGEAHAFDAIGFKAVHGGDAGDGVVDEALLAKMEAFADIAPAHNPAYIAAMRAFGELLPGTPRVAVFETGFHRTVAESRRMYAVPYAWKEKYGVERYGFHGASHRYIAQHVARQFGRNDLRVISCHLGGSSSICALHGECSLANSFGMTPQSGVPHNNRVGDFDAYALPYLSKRTGESAESLLSQAAREGGLLGVSGISNDMRALLEADAEGHARAGLAVEMFVQSVRDYIGSYLVLLGGLDVLVFTGGIGERSPEIRTRVCRGLKFVGISLDADLNASPPEGGLIGAEGAGVRVLAVETNEELVVARRSVALVGEKVRKWESEKGECRSQSAELNAEVRMQKAEQSTTLNAKR